MPMSWTGPANITVALHDGTRFLTELIGSNPRSDIALLHAGDRCLSMKSVSPYRVRIVEKPILHQPRT